MKLQKKIIIINLCLALLVVMVLASAAAYTSLTSAKRVVSTIGSKQLFSSNILLEYEEEDKIQGRSISFSGNGEEQTVRITICNFAQGDKTKSSASNIHYTVKVALLTNTGAVVQDESVLQQYKWDNVSFSQSITFSDTLNSGTAVENIHLLKVPTAIMKDYKIKVTAVSDVEGYRPIGRIISLTEDSSSAAWRLTFLSDELGQNAYDLGSINTKLAGSEHANLTLKWDMNYVDIDPWFLADLGVKHPESHTAEGWCQITFEVGGTDASGNARPNQYNVIFYRTKAVQDDDNPLENWQNIRNYVECSSLKIVEE